MSCIRQIFIVIILISLAAPFSYAQNDLEVDVSAAQDENILAPKKNLSKTSTVNNAIFNDALLMEGFTETYKQKNKETLLAMIQDETLDDIKIAAAVRAFREKFALEIFAKEKQLVMHRLFRKYTRAQSAFIEVEIMYTLCLMDRYKYFNLFMPELIQKLDHYNDAVNKAAYTAINHIIATGNNRAREAQIVFTTLRKILFLSRRRLSKITEPNDTLTQKLKILKWSIKVLGTQELKRLPKEVLNFL